MLRTVSLLLLLAGVVAITAGYVRATAVARCPPPMVVHRPAPPGLFGPAPVLPAPGLQPLAGAPTLAGPFAGASAVMDDLRNDDTVRNAVFYDAQTTRRLA